MDTCLAATSPTPTLSPGLVVLVEAQGTVVRSPVSGGRPPDFITKFHLFSWAHCTHVRQQRNKRVCWGHSRSADTAGCLPRAGHCAWCRVPAPVTTLSPAHALTVPGGGCGSSEAGPRVPRGEESSHWSQVRLVTSESTAAFSVEPELVVCYPHSLRLPSLPSLSTGKAENRSYLVSRPCS